MNNFSVFTLLGNTVGINLLQHHIMNVVFAKWAVDGWACDSTSFENEVLQPQKESTPQASW